MPECHLKWSPREYSIEFGLVFLSEYAFCHLQVYSRVIVHCQNITWVFFVNCLIPFICLDTVPLEFLVSPPRFLTFLMLTATIINKQMILNYGITFLSHCLFVSLTWLSLVQLSGNKGLTCNLTYISSMMLLLLCYTSVFGVHCNN